MSEVTKFIKKLERQRMDFTIKMDLPYKVHLEDRKQLNFKTDIDISNTLLRVAVNEKYKQGTPRNDSRIWAKIQEKLLDDQPTLILNSTQFDWLFDIINNFDYQPGLSSWRWVLIDHLEELKHATKPS